MPKSKKWTEEQKKQLLREIKDFDRDENGDIMLIYYKQYLNKLFGEKFSEKGWKVLISRFQKEAGKKQSVTKKKSSKPVQTWCNECGGPSAITVHSRTLCARCVEGMFEFYSAEIVNLKKRDVDQNTKIVDLEEKLSETERDNLSLSKHARLLLRKNTLLEQIVKASYEQLSIYNDEIIHQLEKNIKLKKESRVESKEKDPEPLF